MPLTGYLTQWQGHRDGDINERKKALYGPPDLRPFVTQVGGAQSVGGRDRGRQRAPSVRTLSGA